MVFLLLLAAAVGARAGEGFGLRKRTVTMTRTRPPQVVARGVRVTASCTRKGDGALADALRRYAAETCGGGGEAADAEVDAELRLLLDRVDASEGWESKTDYEYRQTGSREEWNAAKGRYEKKPLYATVPVTKKVKVMEALVRGSYEIRDAAGSTLAAGVIEQSLQGSYDYGSGAPTPDALMDAVVRNAAQAAAARLVPSSEQVEVTLPRGSLESLLPLAEGGHWDDYRLGVEAMPPFATPDAEAYRLYALAVAMEACAYVTADRTRSTTLLTQALAHARDASARNPREPRFHEAAARIEESGAAYGRWLAGR
jgi:hypothetical protein